MHCSVMGHEALEAAIANYRGVKSEAHKQDEGEIVCKCFGVTDEKIKRVALANNLHTVEEVTNYTKAGGGCGACIPKIEDLLEEVWRERERPPGPRRPADQHPEDQEDRGDPRGGDPPDPEARRRRHRAGRRRGEQGHRAPAGHVPGLPRLGPDPEGPRGGQAARAGGPDTWRRWKMSPDEGLPGQQRHHRGRPRGARGDAARS